MHYMIFIPLAFAANQVVTGSNQTSTVSPEASCHRALPHHAKVYPVRDGCVIIYQQRANERTCEFVFGPETTGYDQDKMKGLCRTAEFAPTL